MKFDDRVEAGRILGRLLLAYKGKDAVIYALPRGGVIVGSEIAKILHLPLDLIITVKIRDPLYPEKALGAVTRDQHLVLSEEVLQVDPLWIAEETERAVEKAITRHILYQKDREKISANEKIAIIVDDGIATGLSMKAAIKELKLHYHPSKIIAAVPVAPTKVVKELERDNVEVVSVIMVKDFRSISDYYRIFPQIADKKVIQILRSPKYRHDSLEKKEIHLFNYLI